MIVPSVLRSEWMTTPNFSLCVYGNPGDMAVVSRMRTRFGKAFNELVDCLLQNSHLLDFKQLHELFRKWDMEYGFNKRPKSDIVMRALAREYRWRIPKCRWLGWNMQPLEDWKVQVSNVD